MQLFKDQYPLSVLPYDGEVLYYGPILEANQLSHYFSQLLQSIPWEHDKALVRGKIIQTKRQVAWYGEGDFAYTYSGYTHQSLPWTDTLLALKALVEVRCAETFNSCLLNYYQSGETAMAWHSDSEKALGKNTVIASLSLGAERKFVFRHKASRQKVNVNLEDGSLLVMKGSTQSHWQHALPKTKLVKHGRINLTFRQFMF
jgi:alkylated DNA repair dioxygenase AlkB